MTRFNAKMLVAIATTMLVTHGAHSMEILPALAQSEAFKKKQCLKKAEKNTKETCTGRWGPADGPDAERREGHKQCLKELFEVEAALLKCPGYKLKENWNLS